MGFHTAGVRSGWLALLGGVLAFSASCSGRVDGSDGAEMASAGASSESGGGDGGAGDASGGGGGFPAPDAGDAGEGDAGSPLGSGGVKSQVGGSDGGAAPEAGAAAFGGDAGAPGVPRNCNEITFDDRSLEQDVLNALGKDYREKITPAEAASLTKLTLRPPPHSLGGIECLINLVSLGSSSSEFPDIGRPDLSPLRFLQHLETVQLDSVPIDDIAPLAEVPKLKSLDLSGSGATNLAPLASAPQLAKLVLHFLHIGDLTPLSEISSLTSLDLWRATIDHPESIASLQNVHELHLEEAHFDATIVATLTELERLSIDQAQPTHFDALASLVNLIELDARGVPLTSANLTTVASMSHLQKLGLASTGLTDVAPLSALTELSELWLDDNAISSLAPLVQNPGIGAGDVIHLGYYFPCDADQADLAQLTDRGVVIDAPGCAAP